MGAPAFAHRSGDLFDRFVTTDSFDGEANAALYAELLPATRREPETLDVWVAFAHTALRLGRRQDAEAAVEHACRLRERGGPAATQRLAEALAILGRPERAASLCEPLLEDRKALAIPEVRRHAVSMAVILGRVDWLHTVSAACGRMAVADDARAHLDWLEASGLGGMLPRHQRLATQILGGVRVGVGERLAWEESSTPYLVVQHVVPGEKAARSALDRTMFDAELALYADHGLTVSDFGPHLLHMLVPAEEVEVVPPPVGA